MTTLESASGSKAVRFLALVIRETFDLFFSMKFCEDRLEVVVMEVLECVLPLAMETRLVSSSTTTLVFASIIPNSIRLSRIEKKLNYKFFFFELLFASNLKLVFLISFEKTSAKKRVMIIDFVWSLT